MGLRGLATAGELQRTRWHRLSNPWTPPRVGVRLVESVDRRTQGGGIDRAGDGAGGECLGGAPTCWTREAAMQDPQKSRYPTPRWVAIPDPPQLQEHPRLCQPGLCVPRAPPGGPSDRPARAQPVMSLSQETDCGPSQGQTGRGTWAPGFSCQGWGFCTLEILDFRDWWE